MTIGRNQHLVPRNGEGHETRGGQRASPIHGTPFEAIDRGREVSCNQHSKLFVHGLHPRAGQRQSQLQSAFEGLKRGVPARFRHAADVRRR